MENIYENKRETVEEVNLWTTIWTAPRKAVRAGINGGKMQFAMYLAIIAGIIRFLDKAVSEYLGDTLPFLVVLIMALGVGTLLGFFSWWIMSGVSTLVGKWLRGTGTYKEMKIAIGISYIPFVVSGILYIFDLLFLRTALFKDVDLSVFQALWILFSASVSVVLSVWSFVVLVKAVAEAHRFSAWRGLATVILPSLVFTLGLVALFTSFLLFV